jgi:hypothetical protein
MNLNMKGEDNSNLTFMEPYKAIKSWVIFVQMWKVQKSLNDSYCHDMVFFYFTQIFTSNIKIFYFCNAIKK